MNKNKIIIYSIIFIIFILFIYIYVNRSPIRDRLSEYTAKAIVLSCMDFRFINDRVYFFNASGFRDNYNKFSLAGASLGYNQDSFPAWSETFDKHIELAIDLHQINEVVVLDHMDCGAYRILYDNPSMSMQEEYELHKINLNKFKIAMNKKYPSLKVTTFLTNLDGSIEQY